MHISRTKELKKNGKVEYPTIIATIVRSIINMLKNIVKTSDFNSYIKVHHLNL